MSRPLSPASSSSMRSGKPTPSASEALPETSSYYHNSIEASKSTQQDQKFRATNNLYRTPSGTTIGSRQDWQSTVSRTNVAAVDDEIADGLAEPTTAEEVRREDKDASDDIGFLPARDARRTTGSILPSPAFFSPKRPPQSLSPTGFSSLTGGAARVQSPLHTSSPHVDQVSRTRRPDTGSSFGEFDRTDRFERRNESGHALLNTSSTYDLGGMSKYGSHGNMSANDVHVISAVADGREPSVRMQASRDGLLHQSASEREKGQKVDRTGKKPGKHTVAKTFSATSKGKKGHLLHQGANRFFFGGLIMTSDDNPLPFLGSMLLMIGLPVLWFVFEASYTWHHVSPAPVIVFAYVWAVAFSSMCVTAWRDPGVLPRDMDPDPPCTAGDGGTVISTADPLAIPLPRIVRVRHGTDLKVKWCDTCGTYRPPRSSHCRVCDNCVENIDHHCTFLNTCIGRRNYFTFFAFLIFSILACFLSIAFCVIHIVFLTRSTQSALPGGGFGEGKSFREALNATPVSAVLFFLSLGVFVPLTTLLAYHVRLVCMNRTTVEQIRINTTRGYSEKLNYDEEVASHSRPHSTNVFVRACAKCLPCVELGVPGQDPNPFAYRGMLRNVQASLVRPMMVDSWIRRYNHTVVDERRPNPATARSP